MSGTWRRNPRPGNTENADAYRCTQRNQDPRRPRRTGAGGGRRPGQARPRGVAAEGRGREVRFPRRDRKSVVQGKSVSVRVALGGRRIIKKKKIYAEKSKANEKHKRELKR